MEKIISTADILEMLPEKIQIDGDAETREVYINGKRLSPLPSQKLRNHSPDGFNWGYGGSGPAQLALAILNHFLPAEVALKLYHSFKFKVIAALPGASDFDEVLELRKIVKEIIEKI